MIRWSEPGFVVAFTTRVGGVSTARTPRSTSAARPATTSRCVDENRRRACGALGADHSRLAHNRQTHSTIVNRAADGVRGTVGDGLWSDEPGLPMLAFAADCLPLAIAAPARGRLAVLHAGAPWRRRW